MSSLPVGSKNWVFTRPNPSDSNHPFFRNDLRQIARQHEGYNLPWRDDMYLAYPSPEAPDWPAFLAYIKQLSAEADGNIKYKIVYNMRRAHKVEQDVPDPALDDLGKKQCTELAANFWRAIHNAGLPCPDVIITSPLARALETVQFGITPVFPYVRTIVLESLRERMTGTGRNKRHDKKWIEEKFPGFDVDQVDEFDQLGAMYDSLDSEEPYEAVWQRSHDFFTYLFEKHEEALVVLVMSHCRVQQTIQREITGWDVPKEERKEAVEFYVGPGRGYSIIVKGTRG